MTAVFHGGKCCGIKTIYGFPWFKSDTNSWELSTSPAHNNPDKRGHHVSSDKPFFTDSAPKESVEERLVRLIAYCKEHRPQGCIEVVLAEYKCGGASQIVTNHDLLLKHGFTVTVPKFLNSNSGNYCQIYHLVYDELGGGSLPDDYDDDDWDDDIDPFDDDFDEGE